MMIFICIFVLFFFTDDTLAQKKELDNNKLEDLEQEEWELLRDYFAVELIKLMAKRDTLEQQIDSLKKLNIMMDNFDCNSELYELVGVFSNEEIKTFRSKFELTENTILSRSGNPKDAWARYFGEISKSNLKCLPEFSERFHAIKLAMNEWEKSEGLILVETYTVKAGDNLIVIAGKILGNYDLWHSIWQLNKEIITNPNIIFPGQVLKLPHRLQ